MLTYEELKTKPRKFLSLTSLTPEEFEELLSAFERAYLKTYPGSKTMTGKSRKGGQAQVEKDRWKALNRNYYLLWSIKKAIHCNPLWVNYSG